MRGTEIRCVVDENSEGVVSEAEIDMVFGANQSNERLFVFGAIRAHNLLRIRVFEGWMTIDRRD